MHRLKRTLFPSSYTKAFIDDSVPHAPGETKMNSVLKVHLSSSCLPACGVCKHGTLLWIRISHSNAWQIVIQKDSRTKYFHLEI